MKIKYVTRSLFFSFSCCYDPFLKNTFLLLVQQPRAEHVNNILSSSDSLEKVICVKYSQIAVTQRSLLKSCSNREAFDHENIKYAHFLTRLNEFSSRMSFGFFLYSNFDLFDCSLHSPTTKGNVLPISEQPPGLIGDTFVVSEEHRPNDCSENMVILQLSSHIVYLDIMPVSWQAVICTLYLCH